MKAPRGARSPFERRAFSLLELTLVIAIVAIMTAIAAPRYGRALSRHRLDMAIRRIEADFALARSRALSLSTSQAVVFNVDPDASTYRIIGMVDPDIATNVYTVRLDREPYRVKILSAEFGDDTGVIYNGYGMPDTGGTVVLRSGSSTGVVEIESPLIGVVVE